VREQTRVWLDHAERDLTAAEQLLRIGQYPYLLFACQQAIEKTTKALIVEQTDEAPPKLHDLVALCHRAGVAVSRGREELLGELTYLYIDTRYPGMETDAAFVMDRENAEHYYSQTREVCRWLRGMIR